MLDRLVCFFIILYSPILNFNSIIVNIIIIINEIVHIFVKSLCESDVVMSISDIILPIVLAVKLIAKYLNVCGCVISVDSIVAVAICVLLVKLITHSLFIITNIFY